MSMDRRPWGELEVARVTVEMESPFLVGSGAGDGLHDEVFATDANGLPTIPGDSLAGIMRHALAAAADPATDELCCRTFGYQSGNRGEPSAVRVSWAQAHDSRDRPVAFRGRSLDDGVLALMAAGMVRDHVRIGAHGAVEDRKKFDELVVPAGARFTFELSVDARSPRRAADLVRLLLRPEVRLGKGTRRGLGRFRVVRAVTGAFDLRDARDRDRYARLPVPLEGGDGGVLTPLELDEPAAASGWVRGTVRLEARDTWLVGGTLPSGREPSLEGDGQRDWDRFPFTERRIEWTAGKLGHDEGRVVDAADAPFVVPGSSVKGALRHRVAFHSRVLRELWMSAGASVKDTEDEIALFGEIRGEDSGRPGRVLVGDARVGVGRDHYAAFQHVCLDRFTQGPRYGLLFDELVVYGGTLEIDVMLSTKGLGHQARRALRLALNDLCSGRLGLGAGRGHGRFHGTVTWDDGGDWMEGA